jgi:hypothetical protein
MKRILFIMVWMLMQNASEKSEWYIELYSDENVIVKVPRDEYLDYKDMLDGYNDEKYKPMYENVKQHELNEKIREYRIWETVTKFEEAVK